MSSEQPEGVPPPTRSIIGRGTLDRLLVAEDSGSLTTRGEARIPLAPQADERCVAHQDDEALSQALSGQVELITLCGGSERDREQLLLRYIARAGEAGEAWLWLELNGEPSPAVFFEQLFASLHIPVTFGLSELISSMNEEGGLDRSLSDEARGEYELACEILCNSLLMRRATGLALQIQDEPRAHKLELQALSEQLKRFATRVPVILSVSEAPDDLPALRLSQRDQRALPLLEAYTDDSAEGGLKYASEELLMGLRLATGSVCVEDLIALAPSSLSEAWSGQDLIEELASAELIKRVEGGSYLMTSAGRSIAYELYSAREPDERERIERRFVSCFTRYGGDELIQGLDGRSGGTLIERYIEAKPQLDAAIDIAVAYSWPEAFGLTLGLCALAERHGPAQIGLRAIQLCQRTALSAERLLSLEITSFMLQDSGAARVIPALEGIQARALSLQSEELYIRAGELLSKILQRRGETIAVYQLIHKLKERLDRQAWTPIKLRLMTTLGFSCFMLQRDDEAYDVLTETIERARELGHLRFEALALTTLGVLHSRWGEHEAARGVHQAAIQIYQHLKSYVLMCPSLSNLADAYRVEGRHEEALLLFERSLKISVTYGNSSGLALVWANMGEEQLAVGQLAEAERSLLKGIELLKEQGRFSIAGLFMGTLGQLYSEDPEGARSYEAHEAFMEGEKLLKGVVGFETERAKLWLKWSLARLTWAQRDEARLAYDFAFQLCSVEDDVELKAWSERVQAEALRAGLSFPAPL